jgi:transposase
MDVVPECAGCRQRDQMIAALQAQVALLQAQCDTLRGQVADLTAEVASLKRKLDERPLPPRGPSPMPPAPPKKRTGKRPGGQPGHPPHLKQLLPVDKVDEIVPHRPSECTRCTAALPAEAGPSDPPPLRHQVAELPMRLVRVTEHQVHARTCPECGLLNRAVLPDAIRRHSCGPRLTAAAGYLVGSHGVSKRGVEEIFSDLFEAPISLGTVANLERELSDALAPAHAEAIEAVRQADVKHLDETGWKQAGRKRWLWLAATTRVAVFLVDRMRNFVALRKLLGPTLLGILCSDRWCVYDEYPSIQRQLCWAHLKRNFEKLLEKATPGSTRAKVAEAALDLQRRVFEAWHLFRGGGQGGTRKRLDEDVAPLMLAFLEVLQVGERSKDAKLKRFCARLLGLYPALWTFVAIDGVEPTNNHAERVLRRAVLWRRRSFGCHSEGGCRFVERIATTVQSLRLQSRSVLAFLHETLHAHRTGASQPSLLPLMPGA